MFSFHKPKVYRSTTGCCICRAKSSSSRFTDSRKYEQDFIQCFQLETPRQGEICNACVLLVKRWKKLPVGSSRNWRHVVDARAGPGMKSMVKFKSKNKHLFEKTDNDYEHPVIRRKKKETDSPIPFESPASPDDPSSSIGSPGSNEEMDIDKEDVEIPQVVETKVKSSRCRSKAVRRHHHTPDSSDFLDMSFWKQEYVCCGTIFVGPNGELLIDPRFFNPCSSHKKATTTSVTDPKSVKSLYSDSGTDSGYDESSNPCVSPESTPIGDSKLTVIH